MFASSSSTTEATAEIDPALLDEAVAEYDAFVEQETGDFVVATEDFLAPVEAGDVDAAKAAYPGARVHFERIEPVAGAFGDLDPDIDGREGDIPAKDWGGSSQRARIAARYSSVRAPRSASDTPSACSSGSR